MDQELDLSATLIEESECCRLVKSFVAVCGLIWAELSWRPALPTLPLAQTW